ncbi:MAG: hypothetical protein JWR37_591 [Mycobacterium sp.]|jgi:hypothetical protein|nr:hypothetical protein [Mycobacterium sp.]
MAVLSGVDEAGSPALYDIPDADLSKHKLNIKPMTDEIRNRLFPGKDKLSKDDAQGVVPAGRTSGGDVEGYLAICWYYVEDGQGDWVYWEEYC